MFPVAALSGLARGQQPRVYYQYRDLHVSRSHVPTRENNSPLQVKSQDLMRQVMQHWSSLSLAQLNRWNLAAAEWPEPKNGVMYTQTGYSLWVRTNYLRIANWDTWTAVPPTLRPTHAITDSIQVRWNQIREEWVLTLRGIKPGLPGDMLMLQVSGPWQHDKYHPKSSSYRSIHSLLEEPICDPYPGPEEFELTSRSSNLFGAPGQYLYFRWRPVTSDYVPGHYRQAKPAEIIYV